MSLFNAKVRSLVIFSDNLNELLIYAFFTPLVIYLYPVALSAAHILKQIHCNRFANNTMVQKLSQFKKLDCVNIF